MNHEAPFSEVHCWNRIGVHNEIKRRINGENSYNLVLKLFNNQDIHTDTLT